MFMAWMVGLYAEDTGEIQPPETGKFFYVDFPYHETHGMHKINVKVKSKQGDSYVSYPLFLSTELSGISMISNKCSDDQCKLTNKAKKYDPTLSANYRPVDSFKISPAASGIYDR